MLFSFDSISATLFFSISADIGSNLSPTPDFIISGSGDLEVRGSSLLFLGGGNSSIGCFYCTGDGAQASLTSSSTVITSFCFVGYGLGNCYFAIFSS